MLRKAIDRAETEQKVLDAQNAQEEEQTDTQRYQYWLKLDAAISAGERLSNADQLTYDEFKQSAAFRTQQEMAAHFKDFYAEQA
jgi:hypothetical protein